MAIMGNDIREGRLDSWLKPEEAKALRTLERSVRRAGRQIEQLSVAQSKPVLAPGYGHSSSRLTTYSHSTVRPSRTRKRR